MRITTTSNRSRKLLSPMGKGALGWARAARSFVRPSLGVCRASFGWSAGSWATLGKPEARSALVWGLGIPRRVRVPGWRWSGA